jgi:hypothetical protein
MNIRHPRLDILTELELAAALRNLDGANLPRPLIDVLEKVAMDRFQVAEIEIALWDAFNDAFAHKLALNPIQFNRVRYIKLIF